VRGFLTLLVVIGVLFFGGRELADRYAHGDPWRTADGSQECRTKLGGTIESHPIVAAGVKTPGWTQPEGPAKQACENAKPN
jgi:hypothetical protein